MIRAQKISSTDLFCTRFCSKGNRNKSCKKDQKEVEKNERASKRAMIRGPTLHEISF